MKMPPHNSRREMVRAFSLIEVMIAAGIFFMSIFTILALVSNCLKNARLLQNVEVDSSMLAAELSMTNRLSEGNDSGDFGDSYKDYRWSRAITEVGTNGLFQVEFVVTHAPTKRETTMSVLFFRPDSSSIGKIGR